MSESTTTIDHFSNEDLKPDFFGTTTAFELTGQRDDLGLSKTPLSIARFGTMYQVQMGHEPFGSKDFIDFLNISSPDRIGQSPSGIAGDWIFATPPYENSDIAKGHRKIPAWPYFEQRAEAYVDIAQNANEPYQEHYSLDQWIESLPIPMPFEKVMQEADDPSIVEQDLARIADLALSHGVVRPYTQEVLYGLAKNPTGLLLKQLHRAGWRNASVVLRKLVELEDPKKYKRQHTNSVISQFSKRPFDQRKDFQQVLVDILAGTESDDGNIAKTNVINTIVSNGLAKRQLIPCIDKEGVQGYVLADAIKPTNWLIGGGRGVPTDYRDLDRPAISRPAYNNHHSQEYFNIELTVVNKSYSGRTRITTQPYTHRGNFKKTRDVIISPTIGWESNRNGEYRDFDLSWSDTQDAEASLPTRHIFDGLFGLMTIQYLSGDTKLPDSLQIKGFSDGRAQRMGAAQLPLLTLMYKRKIESGRLIQAIENFAK